MLSLEPPFYEINKILVYRDHAEATQFYYVAPQPRIARTSGRLMFDLMTYSVELKQSVLAGTTIPDELGAGFLTMGTECVLTETQHANLITELASLTGIAGEKIALYPVPYHKGTVRVLALDQYAVPGEPASSPASPEPIKGRPKFVEQILGSGTPDLLGGLRAIFSLSLSQDGVSFMQGLYKDHAAPVGVVYELKFYGLRPAVQCKITADLSRIYKHFGGGLSGQYGWAKAEVSAGLDFLNEQSAIHIEMTSQAVGEEAQKSKDLAMSLFKEQIVQQMFRPTTPPNSVASGAGAIGSALSKGASTSAVTLTLSFQRTEELKTVEYDYNERSPEERTHSPQTFLPVMLSLDELQQHIHEIDLHNDFFELLNVLVTGPTKEDFDALNLRQVEVALTYGTPSDGVPPESQSVLFRGDSTGDKTFAVKRRGRKSLSYSSSLTYEFAHTEAIDSDRFHYEIPVRDHTGRSLLINPYEDFGVLSVEVEPGNLHPDIREVDILLAYEEPTGKFSAQEHFRILAQDATDRAKPRLWKVRTQNAISTQYTATYTFTFQDGSVYKAPALPQTDHLLRVDSPFHQERHLLIRPNVISPQVDQITVEIEYTDTPNQYARRFLLELAAPFTSQELKWPLLDVAQQKLRYRVTVHEPGFVSENEWEETEDPSLIVGAIGSRVATVQIRLVGATLPDAGMDALAINLQLVSEVPETVLPIQSVLFDGTQTMQEVKLVVPPGTALKYRYQTIAFKTSGVQVESDWKNATTVLLVLQTQTLG